MKLQSPPKGTHDGAVVVAVVVVAGGAVVLDVVVAEVVELVVEDGVGLVVEELVDDVTVAVVVEEVGIGVVVEVGGGVVEDEPAPGQPPGPGIRPVDRHRQRQPAPCTWSGGHETQTMPPAAAQDRAPAGQRQTPPRQVAPLQHPPPAQTRP